MLVMVGVGFASASHVAALLPGLLPLFAASISYVLFGERLSIIRMLGLALIACGAVALVLFSVGVFREGRFVLRLCRVHGLDLCGPHAPVGPFRDGGGCADRRLFNAVLAADLCSALAAVEQAFCGQPRRALVPGIYQGVLMGAVPLFSLSAIVALGAMRATVFNSLVPVLGGMLGAAILSEVPLITEDAGIVAISLGVLLATGIMSLRSRGKAA
jgi:drug/metabolite transporter (DMT)-like permease